MASISDYLESQLLNHIFRTQTFLKPSNISIALTSGVPLDSHTGSTLPELPTGVTRGSTTVSTGYSRINLDAPSGVGDSTWYAVGVDTTSVYAVYSQEVNNSGYFYPLYLTQQSAQSADQNGNFTVFSFPNTFPSISFYAPASIAVSGSANDPGYTLYDGNGFIKNQNQIVFNTALSDWGWVSGVAILDNSGYGSGNMLMYAALKNPRYIYTGDNLKFDRMSLEISLK
ncbi:MAG: hypothetical protein EBU90_10690 [Proteobacteria bacterium]|nr:hypothetical protein [Pseudomonadota bacterium]NBP14568.1 hypothetical protein [bacterium]